jgi:hypothetical protein
MTIRDGFQAYITADSNGQWFVLTDELDMDSAQVSGRWIKTTDPIAISA